MAVLTTANSATATILATKPVELLDVTVNGGMIHHVKDSYTLADADSLGAAAVINMFTIPKGACVIDAKVSVSVALGSGTESVDIGWVAGAEGLEVANDDGFFAAQDVSEIRDRVAMSAAVAGFYKKFAEPVQVQILCNDALAGTGASTITLELSYTL